MANLGDYHYYLDKLEEERELAKQQAFVAEQAAKKAAKTAKAGGKKK
jgi:ATP-binding cassette, subfamily F, member 3